MAASTGKPNYGTAIADFGGAAKDLFGGMATEQADMAKSKLDMAAAQGEQLKGQGDLLEEQSYAKASQLSLLNKSYAEQSTAIQQMQAERQTTLAIGGQRAGFAASGLAESGNAIDILRNSASQGALQKQVLGQQGLIEEASYQQQSESYTNMASAAHLAYDESNIASAADMQAAKDEQDAGSSAQLFGEISAGISAVAGVASMFGV